jgi:hypothetical protein
LGQWRDIRVDLGSVNMSMVMGPRPTPETRDDVAAEKQAALGYVTDAWTEAQLEGIDGDCMAQACLFTAFAELVTTYGEDAAARFAEGLAARIRNGEFSLARAHQ